MKEQHKSPNKQVCNCQADHQPHAALAQSCLFKVKNELLLYIATDSVPNKASQAMHLDNESSGSTILAAYE